MKTLIINLLFALCPMLAFAQGCLPEGITFESQAQINNFQADYPGCTVIEGDVSIVSQWPHTISNLNGLSVLTSIGGSLWIESTYNLHNLNGLNALISIGGDLIIGWNEGLLSMAGLENLTAVGGGVYIGSNPELVNLYGPGNLSTVGNGFTISYNNSMTSLTGVGNLIAIGERLDINSNEVLTSLAGLSNVTSIGGSLFIYSNSSLLSLSGLENIDANSIIDLYITNNSSLTSCEVQCICDYLASPNGIVDIYNNGPGCDNPAEVSDGCGISIACLPYGNYHFVVQADIDNFKTNYPGCNELEGNVIIWGSDITNLIGLNEVTGIGGNLDLSWNSALTNLAGLESLNYLGGGLSLYYMDSIINLVGLENLVSIGGSFSLKNNTSLVSFSGLNSLSEIGGSLVFYNNFVLTSLTGLDSLSSIGGSLILGFCGWEDGGSNPLLNSLSGLENLVSIGEDLNIVVTPLSDLSGLGHLASIGNNFVISNNPGLMNLAGLDNLTTIGGNLEIGKMFTWGCFGNYSMTSLSGLETLTSIGGDLRIEYNDSLYSLNGLNNLNPGSIANLNIHDNMSLSECHVQGICDYLSNPNGTVDIYSNASGCSNPPEIASGCGITLPCLPYGNYYFYSQGQVDSFPSDYPDCAVLMGDVVIRGNEITNLDGLINVTAVTGNLDISFNDNLTDITGLESLTSAGGDLNISYNNSLQNLSGLTSLTTVGGSLNIIRDTLLKSLAGLGSLNYIEGNLNIVGIDSLLNFTGLEELDSAGGLVIHYNNSLTNLTGVSSLASIGGDVQIRANPSLESISGLISMNSIGGMLQIDNNNSLTSLSGLDNIDANSIQYYLYIFDNPLLETCEVQSICDFLAMPNGTIDIHGNAPGCNSQEEVEVACLVGEEEFQVPGSRFQILVYPNPASDKLTFEYSGIEKGIDQIEIYNIFGARVVAYMINSEDSIISIDVSGLPAGIYLFRVRAKGLEQVVAGKIIKN